MSQSFHLVVAVPDADPVAHGLESDSVSVGRSPDNDIQILVAEISKKHATLQRDGDSYKIVDPGSSNGTQVGGKEVDPSGVALENGSALLLGKTVPAYFVAAEAGAEVDPAAVVAEGEKKGASPKTDAVPVAKAAEAGDDAKEGAETVVLQQSPLAPGGGKPPAPAPAAPAKKAPAPAPPGGGKPPAPAAPAAPAKKAPGGAPAPPKAPAPGGAKPPAPAIPAPGGGPKKPPGAPSEGGPKKPPGS